MTTKCSPEDIAIKSLFLGPRSENHEMVTASFLDILNQWVRWRRSKFEDDGAVISYDDQQTDEFIYLKELTAKELKSLSKKFRDETPTYSPRYIGHMISELSLPGLLGHFACLLHNPNNTSKEVAKISSVIEEEAISLLGEMVGYGAGCQGHFCSGGTIANVESVWRARYRLDHWLSLGCYLNIKCNENITLFDCAHMGWVKYDHYLERFNISEEDLKPYSFVLNSVWNVHPKYKEAFGIDFKGPVILVPGNKHFSWQKANSLLGLGEESFVSIPLDEDGRMDANELKRLIEKFRIEQRPILEIVTVAGTTELGEFDPIKEIVEVLEDYKNMGLDFWLHIDAAYGGYYSVFRNTQKSSISKNLISAVEFFKYANSITLDPHKLGYIPYACGAFITKDAKNYQVSKFGAPYLIETDKDHGKWISTLEGSRAGTGSAATWLSLRTMYKQTDSYQIILEKGIIAARTLESKLKANPHFHVLDFLDSNIVCFFALNAKQSVAMSNLLNIRIFNQFKENPHFSITKTILSTKDYSKLINRVCHDSGMTLDADNLVLLRCVLMNPFIMSKELKHDLLDSFAKEVDLLRIYAIDKMA